MRNAKTQGRKNDSKSHNRQAKILHKKDTFTIIAMNSVQEQLIRGVPQGTVLGPLLFNIYVNDLHFNIVSKIVQFADDTVIFSSEKRVQDSVEILEKEVKKIGQ